MFNIEWAKSGEHYYETGVDRGVLYPQDDEGSYPLGVPWNGLINVNESPTGAEASPQYADNIKYLNLMSAEEFGGSIEAFTYPHEFEACDGSAEPIPGITIGQQTRKQFGMCYRTMIGNDVDGQDHGYKLHLMWNALASPSDKSRQTINETPEAVTFNWEFTTTPVKVAGYKPTSTMVVDSTKIDAAKLTELENILYGEGDVAARLPMPDEIIALMSSGE